MAFTINIGVILKHLRPGESYRLAGDRKIFSNLTWLEGNTAPTEQEMLDAELAAAKADRISEIKKEAGERILDAVPQWRQNNIGRGVYDANTTPTLASLNTLIDDIRTDSDTAESDVNALGTIQAVIDFTW